MKIVQAILTRNPCYKLGRKITVKGIMLHSVGCAQPSASIFVDKWNRENFTNACVHAFIDGNDGNVYQTLPWNHRAWHCGSSGNNTHIGVEMCEPASIRYIGGSTFTCSDLNDARAVAKRTYDSAVEMFAMLCKEYGLDPLKGGVIVSHAEGYKRGIASNHGDPEHLWKQLGLGYTMDTFRQAVKACMMKGSTADTSEKFEPYLVRVGISNLNIRKGPGKNYARTGFTGIGIFTIVEEANGSGAALWGRLKSGGWIALDYCNRI